MSLPVAPLISVVLPVFNGVETIGRAIRSIQAQEDSSWELLVMDDGSTDGTVGVVRGYVAEDARIRLVERPHRGLVPTLCEGCALARGWLIARMDADDESLPQRLAAQRQWLIEHPDAGACGTQVEMAGAAIGTGRRRYERWMNSLITHEDVSRDLFVECPLAHPSLMMRRDAYEAVGGYRDFEGPEDYDLVFRLWHGGYQLGNVALPFLRWYESTDRLSMRSARYSEGAFRALKRTWIEAATIGRGLPLYQWGAGEVGKRWLREWPEGVVEAVVDIRPGKIGQIIHGYQVIRPEGLPPSGDCFFLIAVGSPGARVVIRDWCQSKGYTECVDYRFVA